MYFNSSSILAWSLEYYLMIKIKWPEFCLSAIILLFSFLSIRWYLKHNNPVMMHWPILDMLPSLVRNAHRIHDWTVEIANTFGGTKLNRGPVFARLDILLTCDPRNIEYILRTNFSNFPKGDDYKEVFDILGDGLFNVDSHLWHAQRTMARKTLMSKKVRGIIDNMTQKVVQDALLPLLAHVAKQSSTVDLEDVFLRYTFDTSFSIIFGRNLHYLSTSFPPNEFAKAMDDSTEVLLYRHVVPKSWWKLCRWLMIGHEKKMVKAWRIVDQHLMQYIAAKREDMVKGTEASDLLQVYMSFKEGQKDELLSKISSDKFLRDTTLTFLFAGRDTTGSALTWFFWLVSKNPSVEAKILEELNKLVFSKDKKGENGLIRTKRPWVVFDADDLTEMVYLHAAMCESLRLYPTVPLNRKGALKDDVLPDGTVVKSGMVIIMSNYAMGRMETVWGKDCLEFKPERWIDGDGKLNHETMSRLIAFSIGPRICLGKDMAFVLMKSAASAMLFNFHVEVLEGQNIQPRPSVVLQMKNGMMVRIKERVL